MADFPEMGRVVPEGDGRQREIAFDPYRIILKLLQSEGELTIASTGKDPKSGKHVTHEYRVEGPVAIFLTTTAIDVDEELLNRAVVLTVDEERSQTRAIHRLQRERRTLAGLLAGAERDDVLRVHANAQRLLEPLAVVNPYAPELTFLDTRTRTRRDHEKYLNLIDAIALLSQHQREVRSVERGGKRLRYVEVELADIELANRLAHEVLGRSLDELPPQTRRFLERLDAQVSAWAKAEGVERADLRFRARDVREALGLGATQVKVHLRRLVELEYVIVHASGHGVGTAYELVVNLREGGEGDDGDGGRPLAKRCHVTGGVERLPEKEVPPTLRPPLGERTRSERSVGDVSGKPWWCDMASDVRLLGYVRLGRHHRPTGNTRHFLGTSELPPPTELRIVQYAGDSGYYLLYFNDQGEELTDTYHDSLTEAMEQAEWEFGVPPEDWQTSDLELQ